MGLLDTDHATIVVEVHHRRQVRLAPCHLELGDVGDELLHRSSRCEVAVQDVLGYPALLSPVGAVALAPYSAGKPLLSHQLEHGLAADGKALLGPEGHGDLTVPQAVGGAGERLAHQGAHLGPSVGLGIAAACIAVIGAPRELKLVEHELERVFAP